MAKKSMLIAAGIRILLYLCKKKQRLKAMAKRTVWHDEYWLLLLQLYLKRPQGVKPLYNKDLVRLAMELHIEPRFLHRQLFKLRQIDTPRMRRLWDKYGNHPRKLSGVTKLLRKMKGFGNAEEFYEGVETNESWEKDFQPLETPAESGNHPKTEPLMPVHLIMILDLYFRLTPLTMVTDTPEIIELAKLLNTPPEKIVAVMELFRHCDPYPERAERDDRLVPEAYATIWKRFGNDDPEELAATAAQLKEYFK